MRDRGEQAEFRELLIQEHRKVFGVRKIFCQATLFGIYNSWPTKVVAHHFIDYASNADRPDIMLPSVGILINPQLHDYIHFSANLTGRTVEDTTIALINGWHARESVNPKHAPILIERWGDYLDSKGLLLQAVV